MSRHGIELWGLEVYEDDKDALYKAIDSVQDTQIQGLLKRLVDYHLWGVEVFRKFRDSRSQVKLVIDGKTIILYQINLTEEEAKKLNIR